jgi:hypothetical protein
VRGVSAIAIISGKAREYARCLIAIRGEKELERVFELDHAENAAYPVLESEEEYGGLKL